MLLAGVVAATWTYRVQAQGPAKSQAANATDPRAFLNTYCIGCHSAKGRTAGLDLETLDTANPVAHAETWEKVIGRLRAGSMPPAGIPRPDAKTYEAMATSLETSLDRAWAANPNPGRIGAVHRLNRSEYSNAIRDLFAMDVDVKSLLPGDDTADGSFDNFADVLSISTSHLERYLSVARQVTRLATGLPPANPTLERFEMPKFVVQRDRQSEDLPFGSRGGMAIPFNFPVDGEYLIHTRLQRQYQEYLKGMGWQQQLEIRLDGKLLKRFPVGGNAPGRPAATSYAGDGEPGFAGDPDWETFMQLTGDNGLEVRLPVKAGKHTVQVSFVREMWEPEGLPQPTQLGRVINNDQVYMDYANVGSVLIGGPYPLAGQKLQPAKDTAARRAIFVCTPARPADERSCASTILTRMVRLAYRRPAAKADVDTLMEFFAAGRQDGGSFDAGIQFALERMLVDPDFLLRVHRTPVNVAAKDKASKAYKLSDLELASRLSFFLWSSIPDDELLTLAEKNQLSNPTTLQKQVKRMTADPRAEALVKDFAAQWLNLRQVVDVVIDPGKYPEYDDSLLLGFVKETELFVESTIAEDKSVRTLLDADYTFVNERLARHYGIDGVYGTRFRKISLPDKNKRGGLLAQGSILVTTSYPERTSPVLRGKWLLNNIFGLAVPPPPPGVNTALEQKAGAAPKTIRERLEQHRTQPVCNSCHSVIDPLGFALENFDVVGAWRSIDDTGKKVDSVGTTVSGVQIDGLAGLRDLLLARPEQFPQTLTEKLMAYALGRRVEYYDQPSVRKIVHDAAAKDYRWSAIIQGIVESPAFLMRTAEPTANGI
jgi:mono/diheme cytochrome c family protein